MIKHVQVTELLNPVNNNTHSNQETDDILSFSLEG